MTCIKPSDSFSCLENLTQFKLSSITTLAIYWRAQANSINHKPYTNKSLKGMKRKWGPGHLSSHSCSYMGRTAHAPGCSCGFHPLRSLWLNIACVSQNKPSQQRPILQLAHTKLADSDWQRVRVHTELCSPLRPEGEVAACSGRLFSQL